ncbi:MAG: glycosyltransferase family 9 protein [Lepagella sp.]
MVQSNPYSSFSRRVLITRFSALGDLALTIPAIYSACRCYPDTLFIVVTRRAFARIFINPPANLRVEGVDVHADYHGISGIRRLARYLYDAYHPDILVDLHNVLRTRILSLFLRLHGVPDYHLVKPRRQRRQLTRSKHKVLAPLRSQSDRYFDVFADAGLPVEVKFDTLFGDRYAASPDSFAAVTPLRHEGCLWIGIAPFAAHTGKIYPIELMENVVESLADIADKSGKLKVFLFGGGKQETEILDAWAQKYPHVISLAGKGYGFAVELSLFNHLDLVVTMDSGNMHLAAIAGAPTLSIWGATHPYCGFSPWNASQSIFCQNHSLTCRPCSVFGNKPCLFGDLRCLNSISPDYILSIIRKKLQL